MAEQGRVPPYGMGERVRAHRTASKEAVLTLALFIGAILVGLVLRTPTPTPADYCAGPNHVTITTDHAQTILNAPECK